MKKQLPVGMLTQTKAANLWTKEHIQHLIQTNDRAVERALIQIYHRQTADEQRAATTNRENSIGFSAFDAEFLTKIAQQCIARNGLTPGQINMIRPKMMKYWRQLLEIAAGHTKSPTTPAPVMVKPAKKPQQSVMFN
jgi:hypothetical protein